MDRNTHTKTCINCGANHYPTYKGCAIYKQHFYNLRSIINKQYAEDAKQKREQNKTSRPTRDTNSLPHHIVYADEDERHEGHNAFSNPQSNKRPPFIPPPLSQLKTPTNFPQQQQHQPQERTHSAWQRKPQQEQQQNHQQQITLQDFMQILNAVTQPNPDFQSILTALMNLGRKLIQLFLNNQQNISQTLSSCQIL